MKQAYTIGAFAIIFDAQHRVLLCHRRDHDLWNLPGGGVSVNEAPWECVIREVKEEVGLDVEVECLAGVYSKRNENDIVFSFICKVVGGKPTLSDEADQIDYFPIGEIPQNTAPRQVERIKDILADRNRSLIMKVQKGQSSVDFIKQMKL